MSLIFNWKITEENDTISGTPMGDDLTPPPAQVQLGVVYIVAVCPQGQNIKKNIEMQIMDYGMDHGISTNLEIFLRKLRATQKCQ